LQENDKLRFSKIWNFEFIMGLVGAFTTP